MKRISAANGGTNRVEAMSTVQSRDTAALPVVQLKQFYQQFSAGTIARLDDIYTQDIEFRDPVHTMHGCLALKNYLRRMATNLTHYRIRYLDELVGEDTAYLTWELDYAHSRLRQGRIITVRGMSQVRFTSRIFYHEDCYDMGALLYDHVPGLGTATRHLKQRLAQQD